MAFFNNSVAAIVLLTGKLLLQMLAKGTRLHWDPLQLLEGLYLHVGKGKRNPCANVMGWSSENIEHTVVNVN